MLKNYRTSLSAADKKQAIENIEQASVFDTHLLFLAALSAAIATFGLMNNDAVVVIGAMMINPLIPPFLGLAAGIVIKDNKLFLRSLVSSVTGIFTQFLVSFLIAYLVTPNITEQILIRTRLDTANIVIALGAGVIATFSFIWPGDHDKLIGAGTAIALLPPVSVAGIGLALTDHSVLYKSGVLALLNMLAIFGVALIVFWAVRLKRKYGWAFWR